MALYMCSFKIITRSEGRSAVAAAAYRSGERIENLWDGVVHDFTRKSGIVHTEVLLPEQAPEEYGNRSVLWNAVESAEKTSDARLARECLLALPTELTREQQIHLVKDYVRENFVSRGMCADIAVHDPVLTDDLHRPVDEQGNPLTNPEEYRHINPHAHILLTVRPMDEKGRWEAKSRIEYVCRREGAQRGFTADEFRKAQAEGWEKQYRYRATDGTRVWLTPSEAAERGLTIQNRVNKNPRTTPHGRENPTAAEWNDPARVREWRQSWADHVNRALREAGLEERVDARSYAERGIDRLPQTHKGPYVNEEEKRRRRLRKEGFSEDGRSPCAVSAMNEAIQAYNDEARQYHQTERTAQEKIRETAGQMETLRAQAIHGTYTGSLFRQGLAAAQRAAREQENAVQTCRDMMQMMISLNEESERLIERLTQALSSGHLKRSRQRELRGQIASEERKTRERSEYVSSTLRQYGFSDEDALRSSEEHNRQEVSALDRREEQAVSAERQAAEAEREYQDLNHSIPGLYRETLSREREDLWPQIEQDLQRLLRAEQRESFSLAEYAKALSSASDSMDKKPADSVPAKSHHPARSR